MHGLRHMITPIFSRNDGREADNINELLSPELKPDPQLFRQALQEFIEHGFILGKKTIFREIKRKHSLALTKKRPIVMLDEIKREFQLGLKRSIKESIQNEKKVGLFLSGGIDSTSIAIMLGNYFKDLEIHTYTASFPGNDAEVELAKETSEKYCFHHHIVPVDPVKDFSYWYDVIKAIGMPIADAASIVLYKLSREASRDVRVVLMGDGNDELWCGYDWYYTLRERKKKIPYIPSLGRFLKNLGALTKLRLIGAYGEMLEYQDWREFLGAKYLFDLRERLPYCWIEQRYGIARSFGLVAKFPFLAQELVDLAHNVPLELKLRSYNKWIVIYTLAEIDSSIIQRRKRTMGFTEPHLKALKLNINNVKKAIEESGVFRYSPLDRILIVHRKFIFSLYLRYLEERGIDTSKIRGNFKTQI